MRSYETARRSFGVLEFFAKALILVGVLASIPALMAAADNGAFALVGAVPGVAMVAVGFFGLAYIQTSRATVDTAEYSQLSLKLARDQFEISKQLLQHATGTAGAATYKADEAKTGLEEVRYDTDALANSLVAPDTTNKQIDRVHQYSNKQIAESEGKFLIEDKSYDTLNDAKLAIDNTPPREKIS